jgi:DNA-binding helix-hairpin-helix protein with protein kinase domain
MPSLTKGERIPTISMTESAEVVEYIAEGGQGEVYKVNYNGRMCALKWYKKPVPPDAFYENIANNVKKGAPNEHFLWPLMLTAKYKGSYGYIMELRPSKYREFGEFLLDISRFGSYEVMIQAAFNIVESFRILHSKGYSYQDVNEAGFFINPADGDVLICDNDNVAPYGVNLGVKGMARYMAPEVVINQTRPNTHTDRFSLAVLLFRLFYLDHPLEGKYTINFPLTDAIGAQLYGVDPLFIYDPNNDRNRPDPEAHPNVIRRWTMFPPDLQVTFIKAFTKGMKDINNRVTEVEWEDALVKTRGMLVKINGKEQFVNAYAKQEIPQGCRFLKLPEYVVVLGNDSKIYSCHVDQYSADYMTIAGMVKASLSNKDVLGLGNLTDTVWKIKMPNGQTTEVPKNGYVKLDPGIEIDFGGTLGKIY